MCSVSGGAGFHTSRYIEYRVFFLIHASSVALLGDQWSRLKYLCQTFDGFDHFGDPTSHPVYPSTLVYEQILVN